MGNYILMAVYGSIQNDGRVIRSAQSLSEAGYDVNVISLNSIDGYYSPFFKSINIKYKWKSIALLFFWIRVLYYAVQNKKNVDLLYLHDYYMPIVGKFYYWLTRKKWIYDAHELIFNKKKYKISLRTKFFVCLEKISINSAALVISANYERSRLMKTYFSLKNLPVPVLNISDISNSKNSHLLAEEKFPCLKNNVYRLIYQGYISFGRSIDFFVDVLEYLPDNVELIIVGGGNDTNKLTEIINSKSYKNRIHFIGKVPNDLIIPIIKKCHIGIVGYPMNGYNNIYCSPNKIYEYPAAGIPFISTKQPPIKTVTGNYHICEFYDRKSETPVQVASKISQMLINRDYYLEKISEYNANNNWEKEKNKLLNSVGKILNH